MTLNNCWNLKKNRMLLAGVGTFLLLAAGRTAVWAADAASGPSKRVPVILDTDIGDDIDDTWALAMLLGMPQLDLKLVVTDYGNTSERTRLVAKILQRAGRSMLPPV